MNRETHNDLIQWLHEYSIPLIAGVITAVALANTKPNLYHHLVHAPLHQLWQEASVRSHDSHGDLHPADTATDPHPAQHEPHATEYVSTAAQAPQGEHVAAPSDHGWQHFFTLHFLVNDLFMVLFFGIAAKEITEACLPGGALNPISKAVNPLCGTLGGVFGPVTAYLGFNSLLGQPEWAIGWGIPTATDIALAWMVARFLFGAGHPAICFLLLLAVADDAIGLGIIAIVYPDPHHPTEWINALWILPGIAVAYGLRWLKVRHWLPYVIGGGVFSWWGLFSAHLHPALALVFIVPFIPGPNMDLRLYRGFRRTRRRKIVTYVSYRPHDAPFSPLENFEHSTRTFVDFGLFFFALANAGVSLSGVTSLTWIVFMALLVGKSAGVTLFSGVANLAGFKLPQGMDLRHLFVTGIVAGFGLTVALFVSGQAFTIASTQDAAKMGALFSAGVALVAIVAAQVLGVAEGVQFEPSNLIPRWLRPKVKLRPNTTVRVKSR